MPLPLDDPEPAAAALRALPEAQAGQVAGPAFVRFTFNLAEAADLFLGTASLGSKGVAWLNGFCLGRYWSRGPQGALYVPEPVTRKDGNELIILELGAAAGKAEFVSGPDLGHTEV